MTLQQKLDAMNTNKSYIMLYKGKYGTTFHASVEYEGENRESFKLQSKEFDTITEAVDEVYAKFVSLTKSHFKEAVPAQLTFESDSQEYSTNPPDSMRGEVSDAPF